MSAVQRSRSAEPPETAVVAGMVRLLCDVRLTALALATISLVAASRPSAGTLGIVLLALPFSYVPLRSWDRQGDALARSRILLWCDTIMAVVVVFVIGGPARLGEFGAVYASATAALFGVVLGMRSAIAVAIVLALVQALAVVLAGRASVVQLVCVAVAIVGSAWAGDRLAALLRSQSATAEELARARVLEAASHERANLAREMHDSLAKTVHGIGLLSTALAEQLGAEGSRHERTARLIEMACRDANRDTRALIGGLRALTAGSLGDAIETSVRRWTVTSGVPVDLHVDAPTEREVGPDVAWAVVRVLDEALENVRRHAQASAVRVSLGVGREVRLTVSDDGCGLREPLGGTVDVRALQSGGHYGIAGIHERVAALGGTVRLSSAPRVGTCLTIVLPGAHPGEADLPPSADRQEVTA